MLLNPLLKICEKILNSYVRLDPESSHSLEKLAGKIIAIELPFAKFYFMPTQREIHLNEHSNMPADVTLQGGLFDFLRFACSDKTNAKFTASGIKMNGDTETGQDFKTLFANIDIDWEEELSHFTGDIIAHQIGNFFRTLNTWAKKSRDAFTQDLTEYVHEEARLFPAKEELEHFYKEVDHLRHSVERASIRVEKLIRQRAAKDQL